MIYGDKFININESVVMEQQLKLLENSIDMQAINEHVEFIKEAYFGKTEALLELEKEIHELRKRYSISKSYIGSKEVKRIENIVKKQFNMDHFSLNIIPQNVPNAFTYKIATRYDVALTNKLRRMVIADQKNGYRFRDNNGLVIVVAIYGGVLADPRFTDAEIVAILLHEIGHNFADVISHYVQFGNSAMLVLRTILLIAKALSSPEVAASLLSTAAMMAKNTNLVTRVIKGFVDQHPFLFDNLLFQVLYLGYNWTKEIILNMNVALIRLIQGTNVSIMALLIGQNNLMKVKGFLDKPFDFIQKLGHVRQDEIIGDKFAAIYGYGPEQFSALNKLKTKLFIPEEIISTLPFGDVFLANARIANIDSFAADPHPHNIQRLNTMIHSLEFELKKSDLDPDLRKVITNQLKEMNEMKADFLKIQGNEEDYQRIEKYFAAIVENKMPEATLKIIEKKINENIDMYCNKKYK